MINKTMTPVILIKNIRHLDCLRNLELFLSDPHLSLEAKGILGTIHEWPWDKEISVATLKDLSSDSAKKTVRILQELVYLGYLKARTVHDE